MTRTDAAQAEVHRLKVKFGKKLAEIEKQAEKDREDAAAAVGMVEACGGVVWCFGLYSSLHVSMRMGISREPRRIC